MRWFKRKKPQEEVVESPVVLSFYEMMEQQLSNLESSIHQESQLLSIGNTLLLLSMLDNIKRLVQHTRTTEVFVDEKVAMEFMVTDYIPSTIQAFKVSQIPLDKKNDTLVEQLLLLNKKVDEMIQAVYRHDNNQLEINGNFLQQKFGS